MSKKAVNLTLSGVARLRADALVKARELPSVSGLVETLVREEAQRLGIDVTKEAAPVPAGHEGEGKVAA